MYPLEYLHVPPGANHWSNDSVCLDDIECCMLHHHLKSWSSPSRVPSRLKRSVKGIRLSTRQCTAPLCR
ncbi:hypothetical protein EYF80_053407 [Liparis tanakae]|uniref:Uncharacterized protein n=1 Tax=Liparis tanakae TaxID=230148 RepID=A0A4Z2F6D4_9TELE|nr:hypothetical protein EYF80_053407 [Liparis tanakae]